MNALAVKGLCKRYPAFSLENVSFSVPEGAVMGFIGRNGAGKSTTLKSILGLVHPDAGEVTVLGKSFREEEQYIKERIGVVLGGEGNFVKCVSWYDNEWGYSNRVKDLVKILPPVLRQLAGGEVPSLPESVRHRRGKAGGSAVYRHEGKVHDRSGPEPRCPAADPG